MSTITDEQMLSFAGGVNLNPLLNILQIGNYDENEIKIINH